jgi:hypothetical protein
MSERLCSVIILGPGAPRAVKVHLSRRALTVLLFAFAAAFLAAVFLAFRFPSAISESARARLVEENRVLKLEALEAAKGIEQLQSMVSTLEEKSKRIDELSVSGTGTD